MLKHRKYEAPWSHNVACEYRDSNGSRACTCSKKPVCSKCGTNLVYNYYKDEPTNSYLACCPSTNEVWDSLRVAAQKFYGKDVILGTSSALCPCKCGKEIYESTITLRQVREGRT